MKKTDKHIIYTVGHSTHPWGEFVQILQSFKIQTLVDVRKLPGSRKFPQFNQENMIAELPKADIEYLHFDALGGRRKPNKDSKNTLWRNESFRAYADYMETDEFKNAVIELEKIALNKTTAFMCSEAVWWSCHRSMISDYLKAKGWEVLHIMGEGKSTEHPYTSPARVKGDEVFYNED